MTFPRLSMTQSSKIHAFFPQTVPKNGLLGILCCLLFDINFWGSMDIIMENDYLGKTVRGIPYSNPQTALQMKEI